MRTVDAVLDELSLRGDLWLHRPGLVALGGETLRLFQSLERALAALAREEAAQEWALPPALALDTLARAGTLTSFPQWLTVVGHLGSDVEALARVAEASDPAQAARDAVGLADTALPPAVCWHVYARLAGTRLQEPVHVTCQGTCWRHETEAFVPLERGWAFTMREIVCLGDADTVGAFRDRGRARTVAFARSLGLDPRVAPATDPFFAPAAVAPAAFAPAARGRELLQRMKGLKDELLLPVGPDAAGAERHVAAASFNDHERFFGEAFGIRMGRPVSTGCVAFGIERWLLAFLVEHGTRPADWPGIPRVARRS